MRLRRKRGSSPGEVRLGVDYVDKEVVVDADAEFRKSALLHEAGLLCGFRAPRPIAIVSGGRFIRLERLTLGRSLSDRLRDRSTPVEELLDTMSRAGVALGGIHALCTAVDVPVTPLPVPIRSRLTGDDERQLVQEAIVSPVISHSDFGTGNIFWADGSGAGTLSVLDPFPNLYSSFGALIRESRYLDLALMDSCFMGRGDLSSFLTRSHRVLAQCREAFLEGYQASSNVSIDPALVRRVATAVLGSYFEHRRGAPMVVATLTARVIALRQIRVVR